MSEKPFGGVTSDVEVMLTLLACAKTVCVSGSYATPGQLVPPIALPMLIAPRMPFGSPSIGGLYIPGITRYRFMFSIAIARSSGVKSIRSSGSVSMLREYAGGLVGYGCVGLAFSPGMSLAGTGRSSIGHTGWPV